MKTNWKKIRQLVLDTDKSILLKVCSSCEGHDLSKPEKFTELGLGEEIVTAFTRRHKSDFRDPKSTIFVQGRPVEYLDGVYEGELVEFIASCFEVTSWKSGRGSRVAHLTEQLGELWKVSEPSAS